MSRYTPAPARPPSEATAPVYAQVRRDLGFAPQPLTLHAPLPELLAAAWATLRETVLVEHRLPRRIKEAMAVAVSEANRCPYCVDAHAIGLHAVGAKGTEAALRRGRREGLDARTRALVAWAEASRTPESPLLADPPFTAGEQPEAVGTALCFHYINRMVTVLLGERLLPVRRAWLRSPLLYMAGWGLSGHGRRRHPPGEALRLVAAVPVPPHLAWAAGVPEIASAFAALWAAVEAAGARVLGEEARRYLRERLAAWQGEEPPPGSGWIEGPLAGLPAGEAAAGRLVLLGALAPHRVHEGEVAAFRRHWPGDAPLVGTLAWASYGAARRISEWLVPGWQAPAATSPAAR